MNTVFVELLESRGQLLVPSVILGRSGVIFSVTLSLSLSL